MELRTLKYFVEICKEGTMSRAAEKLHVSQPALSRQISELERSFGRNLLIRHSRSVEPTEEGLYLLRRATEILELANRTETELRRSSEIIEGDISIASGDSAGLSVLAKHVYTFQELHPHVRFHFHSGNAEHVTWRLERGLDEFAVMMGFPNMERYESIDLGYTNIWGVYLPEGHPLERKAYVTPADLAHEKLIGSEQSINADELSNWFGSYLKQIEMSCTYTLPYLATYLVKAGLGVMLGYLNMFPTGPGTGLSFRPMNPQMTTRLELAWKRDQTFTNASHLFLESLKRNMPTV